MRRIFYFINILILFSFSPVILNCGYLDVFDIDTAAYPIVKAKFYVFDNQGKRISSFSPAEFSVTENNNKRKVLYTTCQPFQKPQKISAVLTIDISSSMRDSGLKIAKAAAISWINEQLPDFGECALTTFNDDNYLNSDFTDKSQKLIDAINTLSVNGSTDFEKALLLPIAGSLEISKNARYKKVIVFLTDGRPNQEPPVNLIISEAKNQNCAIYSIVLGSNCPHSLKEISLMTGGKWFENIENQEEAIQIYKQILTISQGNLPCVIQWQSDAACDNMITASKFTYSPLNYTDSIKYVSPENAISKLEFLPPFANLYNIPPGSKKDTVIKITAVRSDFLVKKITSTNSVFTVNPKTFIVKAGESKDITVSFIPSDSGYISCKLIFESDSCPSEYHLSGGYKGKQPISSSLRLIKPNGGEVFPAGGKTEISWDGISAADSVIIEYSHDSAQNWKRISSRANGLKYVWNNIPKPVSDKCLIRIKQLIGLGSEGQAGDLNLNLQGHTGYLETVKWSPDGSLIATAGDDHKAYIWDASTGECKFKLSGHTDVINSICWSPDAKILATGSWDNTAVLWDVSSGIKLKTLSGHKSYVWELNFSPDGKKIVTGSWDSTAMVWDVKTGNRLRTLAGHSERIYYVSFSPDGSKIVSSGCDNTAIVWNASTGVIIQRLTGHGDWVIAAPWSPDGSKIATASLDNTIRVWNPINGILISTLKGHQYYIWDVNWSPDGKRIASASYDSTAVIWDVLKAKAIYTLKGHSDYVNSVNWSPDGSKIASGSRDGLVKVWNNNNGRLMFTLSGHKGWISGLCWSPDGSRIASSSLDLSAKVWYAEDVNTVIQTDISDTTFTIAAPLLESHDIDFGQEWVASRKDSIVKNLIKNTGNYDCIISDLRISGADSADFGFLNTAPFKLKPGESREIEFIFKPQTNGIKQSVFIIESQDSVIYINLKGEGLTPFINAVSNVIDFGKTEILTIKDTFSVPTIINTGTSPLIITKTLHIKPNDKDFSTLKGSGPFTLQPGDTAKMDFRFNPVEEGRTAGAIEFHYNGFRSPFVIKLYGQGVKNTPGIRAEVQNFNNLICKSVDSTILRIVNSGGSLLNIKDIILSGSNPTEFRIGGSKQFSIESDSSHEIIILFNPLSTGSKSAEIEINSNAFPDSLYKITVNSSKDSANLNLDLSEIKLGYLFLNEKKDTLIKISNTGNLINSAELKFTSNLNLSETLFTVNPGASKEIKVSFKGFNSPKSIYEEILLTDSICGRIKKCIISGDVIDAPFVKVKISSQEASPGDTVEFTVSVTDTHNTDLTLQKEFILRLNYNNSLLSPLGFQAFKIDSLFSYINIKLRLDSIINTKIKFIAGLGNAEFSEMKLSDFESTDSRIKFIPQNGYFRLSDICREGGTRLFNPNSRIGILSLSPNPASGEIYTEFNRMEEKAELSLYNSIGTEVRKIDLSNLNQRGIIRIDISNYSDGLYYLKFNSESFLEFKRIIIQK